MKYISMHYAPIQKASIRLDGPNREEASSMQYILEMAVMLPLDGYDDLLRGCGNYIVCRGGVMASVILTNN